jgi:hypothetical protein
MELNINLPNTKANNTKTTVNLKKNVLLSSTQFYSSGEEVIFRIHYRVSS